MEQKPLIIDKLILHRIFIYTLCIPVKIGHIVSSFREKIHISLGTLQIMELSPFIGLRAF